MASSGLAHHGVVRSACVVHNTYNAAYIPRATTAAANITQNANTNVGSAEATRRAAAQYSATT